MKKHQLHLALNFKFCFKNLAKPILNKIGLPQAKNISLGKKREHITAFNNGIQGMKEGF